MHHESHSSRELSNGTHTCERTDQPMGKFIHTNWTGKGGSTAASTYTV
jgi:6-phosphogluconate dehydrogenase